MSGADSFGMGRTFILAVLVVAGYMLWNMHPFALQVRRGLRRRGDVRSSPQRGS